VNPHYPLVALRAHHRCEYCRAPEFVFNFPFEVEHVIPLSQEGEDVEFNWALACRSCNVHKGSRTRCIDSATSTDARFFHPRQDHWDEHFYLDPNTGEIAGITAVGRATVACLNMNSQAQLAARRQWLRLGLFP
jgi:hypothetical protein